MIHILKGTGNNCTCYDCPVLYGGDCPSTPVNNFLDKIENLLIEFLSKTPTGRPRRVSSPMMERVIEEIIRMPFCKKYKISKDRFYNGFYLFLPLVFLMTSDKKDAKEAYRKARIMLFYRISDEIKTLKLDS